MTSVRWPLPDPICCARSAASCLAAPLRSRSAATGLVFAPRGAQAAGPVTAMRVSSAATRNVRVKDVCDPGIRAKDTVEPPVRQRRVTKGRDSGLPDEWFNLPGPVRYSINGLEGHKPLTRHSFRTLLPKEPSLRIRQPLAQAHPLEKAGTLHRDRLRPNARR